MTLYLSVFLRCVLFAWAVYSPDQPHKERKVLLLSMDNHDNMLLTQQRWLRSDPGGLAERDIAVTVITKEADDSDYRRLKPSGSFVFILYGKDGGEKYRSVRPVPLKTLYAIIDAMPMRKQEMGIHEK